MQVKKYFEKKVSLLSTSDVRYDGELYTVDPSEQSIALKHVNCMGTEGRRTGDQAIAPSDCTYEFIIFRAVNIRELWLDEGNGRKRDLTDEILLPLRQGHAVKRSEYDQDPSHPKRKVGFQSRNAQQQQQQPPAQGYSDPYYQQAPYEYGQAGYGGYGRGGAPYEENAMPPLPNQSGGGYYPPPQSYYDTPNAGYYGQPQQGYAQQGYPRQRGYQRQYQGGYQRQRAPQYYNQQRPQYYTQGYPPQQQYYQQPRRYPQQYNRSYGGQQQQQYGRGYYGGQQRRGGGARGQGGQTQSGRGRGGGGFSQAGTGAYLDNRRLRGDEIDIKDQQDFDFSAAKNEFDLNKEQEQQVNGDVAADESSKKAEESAAVDDAKAVPDEEETKVDEDKKYDKTKSFFDGLQTETKKSKPKQDMQTQKDVDTATFGSVAQTYKSRHINPQQRGRQNYYQQNRGQGGYQQNRRTAPQQQRYAQNRTPQNYGQNRWVVRR